METEFGHKIRQCKSTCYLEAFQMQQNRGQPSFKPTLPVSQTQAVSRLEVRDSGSVCT